MLGAGMGGELVPAAFAPSGVRPGRPDFEGSPSNFSARHGRAAPGGMATCRDALAASPARRADSPPTPTPDEIATGGRKTLGFKKGFWHRRGLDGPPMPTPF